MSQRRLSDDDFGSQIEIGVLDTPVATIQPKPAAADLSSDEFDEFDGDSVSSFDFEDAFKSPRAVFGGEAVPTLVESESSIISKGLGTIGGVFVPCSQNILGVLLFLRLPFITGQAGAGLALLIVFLSVCVSTLTTLSMSAVATNGKIKGGGAYYLISRNLGPAFGAAVGVCFALGTVCSCALYVLGAVEAFVETFPGVTFGGSMNTQILALILLSCLFCVVYGGVQYVSRVGPVFFGTVLLGILSVLLGLWTLGSSTSSYSDSEGLTSGEFSKNFGPSFEPGVTFMSMLALFFPSVTGFMAGSNRSAFLKDPSASIPKGSLGAIAFTTTLYILWIFFFAAAIRRDTLLDDKFIVPKISWPLPALVKAAIMFSSAGAGLQTLAGAPNLFNAIAKDFSKDIPVLAYLEDDVQPRKASIFCTLVCACLCLTGDLEIIAPITTMFFLLCYGSVNFACLLVTVLDRPSWRPTWRYYHWSSAGTGAILCVVIMFAIQWSSAMAAIAFAACIHQYIHYKGVERDWGDGLLGLKYNNVVRNLLELEKSDSILNWRPQFLLLYELKSHKKDFIDKPMLNVLGLFRKTKSVVQIAGVEEFSSVAHAESHEPSFTSPHDRALTQNHLEDFEQEWKQRFHDALDKHIRKEHLPALQKIVLVDKAAQSIPLILQSIGIGPLSPNLVLASWPKWQDHAREKDFFVATMNSCEKFRKALAVFHDVTKFPVYERGSRTCEKQSGTIDVWWQRADGGMMLLLAQLLQKHRMFRACRIRLFSVAFEHENSFAIKRKLETFLHQIRIKATVHVVEFEEPVVDGYIVQKTLDMEERHNLLSRLPSIQAFKQRVQKPEYKIDATIRASDGGAINLSELARHLKRQQKQSMSMTSLDAQTCTPGHSIRLSTERNSGHGQSDVAACESASNDAKVSEDDPSSHGRSNSLMDLFSQLNQEKAANSVDKADAPALSIPTEIPENRTVKLPKPELTNVFVAEPTSKSEDAPETTPDETGDDEEPEVEQIEETVGSGKPHLTIVVDDDDAKKASEDEVENSLSATESVTHSNRLAKMAMATTYNNMFKNHSSQASLLITNLPQLDAYPSLTEHLTFTETLIGGLDRVILVRGTNAEVVTSFM